MKSFIATILSCALLLPVLGAIPFSADATETNPLNGKSVLFVGDSICEAACEWGTSTVGWADRIIKWNSMTGLNKGLSGASISNVRGANTVLNQLIPQKGINYDYIIIEGGANDAWDSAPVGKMTKGFEGNFDMTTFAGGLETTFKYAKENFPNATIGFIITFQMPSANYGRLADMSEYFAESKRICDKWEVPYIDFYFDQYFNDNVLKPSTLANTVDYIHPNKSGYDILSPRINDWMKTLDPNATTSKNIARYKPYTVSGTGEGFYYVSGEYGTMDYRGDLTDEKAAEVESFDSNWFGFYNGEIPNLNTVDGVGTVIIDLEKQANIEGFSIHFWNSEEANIKAPLKATVSVSEYGTVFTEIGTLNITSDNNTMYWADLNATAAGRYVKFDIDLGGMFCFLNEIKVIGELIDDGNSGSDITVDTNIALNKPYTVSGSGDGFYYVNEDGSVSQYQAKLTDGINSDFQNFNNEWFAFYSGTAAPTNTVNGIGTVIIDLEANYDIYSVRAHLWNCDGANAKAPYCINISVSENGVDFVNAGSVDINYTTDTIYWGKSVFSSIKGRYVKLEFQLQTMFAFVNELHVYGTPSQDDGGGDDDDGEEKPVTPEYKSGDINNDGKLTATDYFMLKKLCFQTLDIESLEVQETAMLRSDMNGDEKITATDYFMLKRKVFAGA